MSGEGNRSASAPLGLRPYQHDFVVEFFSRPAPHSHILVAPAGTGKLRTALEMLARVRAESPTRRVAFFSDRVEVVKQAHALFLSMFPDFEAVFVDRRKFWSFSELQTDTGGEVPWPQEAALFIPSKLLDFDEVKSAFRSSEWALVIFDGALDVPISRAVVEAGILGTEGFVDRSLFLVPSEQAVQEAPLAQIVNTTRVSVTSWSQRTGPGRHMASSFRWIEYERTTPEAHLIEVVTNGLGRLPGRHWAAIRERVFASVSSSPLALEALLMTLRRVRNTLVHSPVSSREIVAWFSAATATQQVSGSYEDGSELGVLIHELFYAFTGQTSRQAGISISGVQVDHDKFDPSMVVPEVLMGLEWVPEALRGIDSLVEDTKLNTLISWLSEPQNSEGGVCILTTFDATAKYVESELSSQGLSVLRLSSQDPDLVQTYESLREARFVVSTIRQLRGIEHGAMSTVFYDLPESLEHIAIAGAHMPRHRIEARRLLVMRPQVESFAWEESRIRELLKHQ